MNKLAINTGLAFVAGFVTSFGGFMAVNPNYPGYKALVAAGAAAVYAGGRAVVGYLADKYGKTIPVDA